MDGMILLIELIILYYISRFVTQGIFSLGMLIFRSRPVSIMILLLVQFPGTVVHELSHLFMAEILRVPTGKLSLVPESIRDNTITTGSVMVAETDPVRKTLIGIAPVLSGMTLLAAISLYIPSLTASMFESGIPLFENMDTYIFVGVVYCLYAVSNTMFSSKEDMKGVFPVLLVAGLITGGLYAVGIRLNLTGTAREIAQNALSTLTMSLGWVLALNAVTAILLRITFSAIMAAKNRRRLPVIPKIPNH